MASNTQAAFDPHRPPMVPPAARSAQGDCFICGKPLFTAFVRVPVVRGQGEFFVRAHASCYRGATHA